MGTSKPKKPHHYERDWTANHLEGGRGISVYCYPTVATGEAGTNVGDPLCLLYTA